MLGKVEKMATNTVQNTSFRVERVSDDLALTKLRAVVAGANCQVASFRYTPVFMQGGVDGKLDAPEKSLQDLLDQKSYLIRSFAIATGHNFRIWLDRRLQATPRDAADEWQPFDIVHIDSTDQQTPADRVLAALLHLRNEFSPLDNMSVLNHLTAEQQQFYIQREGSLHRLEELQGHFFDRISTFTVEQAQNSRRSQLELESSFQKRHEELEAKHQAAKDKLDLERTAFEEEKRLLDLRDSTAVRRSIRQDIKEVIKGRRTGVALSSHAKWWSNVVLCSYISLILILAGMAGFFVWKDFAAVTGSDPSPWLIARQLSLFLAFAVTTGFFIRWLNGNAERHVVEEFHTQKYELDFERASFVVEWAMEWAKDQKDVPQFLIERLSRGLFDMQSSESGPVTAADAVASALFGSAASAKLKLGDNEVTLDRKGITRLKKSDAVGEHS